MISWLRSVSRFPVGSSASRISGRVTMARAMATRCCCPPESSPGVCLSQPESPREARTERAMSRLVLAGRPR